MEASKRCQTSVMGRFQNKSRNSIQKRSGTTEESFQNTDVAKMKDESRETVPESESMVIDNLPIAFISLQQTRKRLKTAKIGECIWLAPTFSKK